MTGPDSQVGDVSEATDEGQVSNEGQATDEGQITDADLVHVGHERRWAILGVLTVCLVVVIMGNTILNVALRRIQEDLDATQGELQWAVDAYILVFAGPGGRMHRRSLAAWTCGARTTRERRWCIEDQPQQLAGRRR